MKYPKKNKILLYVLFIVFIQTVKSQNNNYYDSLTTKSYTYLYSKLGEFYRIPAKGNIYAKAYLDKAKDDNDSIKIVEGFYFLSNINKNDYSVSLKYINNAIDYNKDNPLNLYTPYIYTQKGKLFHKKGNYKNALDNYLKAQKSLIHFNYSPTLSISIDHNIGLVRISIKDFNGALFAFNKSYRRIIKNNFEVDRKEDYLNSLSALSIAHLYKKNLDSASYYNELEINEAKNYNSLNHFYTSKIMQGFINYEKGEYRQAYDSISKYIKEEINDSLKLSISRLYLGKSAYKLGYLDLAIEQFKKVDTIVQKNQKYLWEIEENYEFLRNYYKDRGDIKNQLLYLEKLLEFSKKTNNNNDTLKNTIVSKYDTPKLIAEKEVLITKLQKSDQKKSKTVYLLSIVSLCLIIIASSFYIKRSVYKKRFETLLQENKTNINLKTNIATTIKKELTIPKEIVTDILMRINVFEEQKVFLNNSITLDSLAKKLKTNSNYLSKIINFHKHKNFSTYLSDLRINYAIELLKSDHKFRNYTIKAIAFEVGFKNSKSFTNAFYKQTKLYPSYFIKELEKRELVV